MTTGRGLTACRPRAARGLSLSAQERKGNGEISFCVCDTILP